MCIIVCIDNNTNQQTAYFLDNFMKEGTAFTGKELISIFLSMC